MRKMQDTKTKDRRPEGPHGPTVTNLPKNSAIGAPESLGTSPKKERTWRRLLSEAIRDPDELCDLLQLPDEYRRQARQAALLFPLVVPRGFVDRMRKQDPADPLLMQVLPAATELLPVLGFVGDPLEECKSTRAAGLIHKYHGRVLLILNGVCAIHCRYCFRREFPYESTPRGLDAWEPALEEIRADSSIEEAILSGGDPLTMTDEWLARLAEKLAEIPHLRRLRIHTRIPIVIPERVTDELIAWLKSSRLQPILVVHVNHPNEIDENCANALGRLVDSGILVLNQSVLLRGINDDAGTLAALSLRLIELRVWPYYLHQLDRVSGAGPFEVPVERGRAIQRRLRELLPGYAVPQFVQEIPGEASKTPL